MTTPVLIGASLGIANGMNPLGSKEQIIARLICVTGIGTNAAVELAARPRPELPQT